MRIKRSPRHAFVFENAARLALPAMLLFLHSTLVAAKDCGETQMEMTECAGKEFDKADAQLNAVYKKLAAKVSPEGKEKLVAAQRAWIKYRDAQCRFDTFGTRNGSINAQLYALCATEMTGAQTRRLQGQLDCQEGDLSCGGQ